MQTGRIKAAAGGNHRLRAAAQTVACGVLLAVAALLSPQAARADPDSQLTVIQSGVRLRLGMFVLGTNWVTMTVIVENERDSPVWLAAIADREEKDTAQAVLSDEHGKSCEASANPGGIAEIPALTDTKPASAEAAMTEVPAHNGMNVVFDFQHCRLSRASPLSLGATFGLSTDNHALERFRAKFWGIVQKTRMR